MINAEMKAVRQELTSQSIKVANMATSQGPTKLADRLREVERLLDEARQILFDLED